MKKVISTIVIILSILLFSSYVLGATGKITADTLNIRESASQSSKVIARIAKDQKVEILEDNGEWLKVKYKDYTGYVSSKFVSKDEVNTEVPAETVEEKKEESTENAQPVENTEPKKEETTKVVSENKSNKSGYISNREAKLQENVKVYSLPTLSSYSIGDLNNGTSLVVINSAGQWAYIQTDTLSGWIKLSATDVKAGVTTTENTETTQQPAESKPEETSKENVVAEPEESKPVEPVKEETPTEATASNGSFPKTMYTNKDSVIIRYKPDKGSEILNSFSKNTKVNVTAKEGDWYKVTVRGDTGYIYYTLLSDKES